MSESDHSRPVLASSKFGHVRYAAESESKFRALEHDPEKWEPFFGKDHAQTRV
jgi:hypothetical protein